MALNGIMSRNIHGEAGQAPLHLARLPARQGSDGQAGLIVLLIMVVVTTVAVSVSTRSVSELRISRQEQESTRTLNLAESGIEELLKENLDTILDGNDVTTGVRTVASTDINFKVEKKQSLQNIVLLEGHSVDIDVNGATNIGISWPSGSGCSLVVSLISDSNLERRVWKNGSCLGIGDPLVGSIDVTGYKNALIKAVGGSSTISVSRTCSTCTGAFLYELSSTATLADGSTRKVTVYKTPGSLPSIFDYVLFSGTSLTK
jgi:hypothetical protein